MTLVWRPLLGIADERRLPFEVKVPNARTRNAIEELESGGGEEAGYVEEFMAKLSGED